MKRRFQRVARDGAAVFIGLAVAVGVGEGLLRVFWPQRSSVTLGMFRSDPEAGYRLRANYSNEVRLAEYRTRIFTDNEGYRVPEVGQETPTGARRLLAIGDSFTFGVGVDAEDAWPEVLRTELSEAGAPAWTVRNGGVGGYGPLRSSRLFLSSQSAWDPAVVVHALYVGNDLEDPKPETFRTNPQVKNGRMVSVGRHPLMNLRIWVRVHSHFYIFVRNRFHAVYMASGLAPLSQYFDPSALAEWPPRIRDVGWPAGQAAIDETARWCRDRGVGYLVVIVPTRYQVDDESWDAHRKAWKLPPDAFDRDHAQRVVGRHLQERGIPVIDLLPILRDAARTGAHLYYGNDPHWTAEGHRLAALETARRIADLGWTSIETARR